MNTLILKPGKEKSLLRRHPWLYVNAIDRVDGQPAAGATVLVRAHEGRFLARAAYSPVSSIRARVWTLDEQEPVDHAFFKRRVQRALAHRRAMVSGTGATRLIFGEADGLPGLIVDHYRALDDGREQLVCQFMAVGVEAWKPAIVAALIGATGCPNVYERSDVSIREKEGLAQTTGVLAGDEPPEWLLVDEGGVRYRVDVRHGHKTGFYVDQRDNRALIARHALDREVLNCFLLYRGLFAGRAQGRRETGRLDRFVGRGPGDGRGQRAGQRLRPGSGTMARRGCVQDPARAQRRGRAVRSRRARSAQVRAVAAAYRPGGPRLQGHQPVRIQAVAPGRSARDVFMLGRDRRAAVPEDHRGRRGRRGGRRADPRPARRGRRSPDARGFFRKAST